MLQKATGKSGFERAEKMNPGFRESQRCLRGGRHGYKVGLVDGDPCSPSASTIADKATQMRRADGADTRHYRHIDPSAPGKSLK
jgi:hypothetical protein